MKKFIAVILFLINVSVFSQHRNQGGRYTSGSSHKGEHYRNKKTNNHYTSHRT
jgi:hypothetical protein